MAKRRFSSDIASPAFTFVLMMGIVNLFGDMTYEGGGSINGQFMAMLGATGAAISITAGLGEFFGYILRPASGYIADKTQRYWTVTFVGYAINSFAVPAMVFAGSWPMAAALILLERIGRAIRKPTVEAMLSYTPARHGKGWVYGVNTALDETGATLGPLLIALVLFLKGAIEPAMRCFLSRASWSLFLLLSLAKPIPFRLGSRKEHPQRAGDFPDRIGFTWQQAPALQQA
jgi:hypothetical protein